MQAIITRYIGPTDHRGSRVKACCQAGSVTLGWDDALGPDENHDAAAVALARKLGWDARCYPSRLVRAGSPDGHGNVYSFCYDAPLGTFILVRGAES